MIMIQGIFLSSYSSIVIMVIILIMSLIMILVMILVMIMIFILITMIKCLRRLADAAAPIRNLSRAQIDQSIFNFFSLSFC